MRGCGVCVTNVINAMRLPRLDSNTGANHSPHVVILGEGASRAALPGGDRYGPSLPVMDSLIADLSLHAVLKSRGIDLTSGNFEAIYDALARDASMDTLREELERRVRDYFQSLELPTHATLYDALLLGLSERTSSPRSIGTRSWCRRTGGWQTSAPCRICYFFTGMWLRATASGTGLLAFPNRGAPHAAVASRRHHFFTQSSTRSIGGTLSSPASGTSLKRRYVTRSSLRSSATALQRPTPLHGISSLARNADDRDEYEHEHEHEHDDAVPTKSERAWQSRQDARRRLTSASTLTG